MSNGAVFTILTNDGKQDQLLNATRLLGDRLRAIKEARMRDPSVSDPTPSLADVERTHILFMNAHFKPFASMGFEYNKQRSGSGNVSLGGSAQFSIQQYGDFFSDFILHVTMDQPTLTADSGTAASDKPLMRWCAFPGERLCRKVKFSVNGNPLDEYESVSYNFHRETQVAPGKRTSWDRCVGQEIAQAGFVDRPTWAKSGVDSSSSVFGSRLQAVSYDGLQTPSGQKTGQVEFLVPLLFWCRDPRLAVPSAAIPYGQRFVDVEFAELSELCDVVPRGAGTWSSPLGQVSLTNSASFKVELYVNNLFDLQGFRPF